MSKECVFPSWDWNSSAARRIGDESSHARWYLDMIDQSDYAEKLAPVVGMTQGMALDIGAGSGAVTRRCLSKNACWIAVEPNAEMGRVFLSHVAKLAGQGIQTLLMALRWQDLPADVFADTAFAFNVGATHHEAAQLFDNLAARRLKEMVWAVPAQKALSTFCLAGYLSPEFHGDQCTPAYLRTLEQLGLERRPERIDFVDWTCRYRFRSLKEAISHFLDRMGLAEGSPEAGEVKTHLIGKLGDESGEVRISCPKRSAVMRWRF